MISKSAEQTMLIGELMGRLLEPGDIVALTGELGAGKTCLTKGIARGLGVSSGLQVTSPTFTLMNEYPGEKVRLIHVDTYRLSGPTDLEEMGYEDYFFGNNVVVVEWAEKIRDLLPQTTVYVTLRYVDENSRQIDISGDGDRSKRINNALQEGGFE